MPAGQVRQIGTGAPRSRGFAERAKDLLRALVRRAMTIVAGCILLAATVRINAGPEIVAGLVSPESSFDIAVSVARIAGPLAGLWLIYKGLR